MLTNELEEIIFNISEFETRETWAQCEQSIEQGLKEKSDFASQIVGLRVLREVCRAHHLKLDSDRRIVHYLAEKFLPILEEMFAAVSEDGNNPF